MEMRLLLQAPDEASGFHRAGHPAGRNGGFTLIELMIVLVLMGILLGVMGPSFQTSIRNNRLQTSFNDIASALAFARGEAIVRTQPISMCPTTDGTACSGANWETGYLVFVDNGAGGVAAQDGTWTGAEELLRIGDPAPPGVTIRSLGFTSLNNVIFLDDGRVLQNQRGTVMVCDERGAAEARALVVEVSGQPRFAVDINGDGVVEDHIATATTPSAIGCP